MISTARRERPPLDARALTRIARRAGKLCLASAAGAGGSPDPDRLHKEVLAAIKEDVADLAPQVGVIARGTAVPRRASWLLAVSPVDGADAFAAGIPTWAVSLGLVRSGSAVGGAVLLPALGQLYLAMAGVLRCNNEPLANGVVKTPPRGFILGRADFQRRSLLSLRRRPRMIGSPAYHLSLVARGDAQGAVLGRACLWEIAAGAALVRTAGGEIVELPSGAPADLAALSDGLPSRGVLVALGAGADESVLRSLRRRLTLPR